MKQIYNVGIYCRLSVDDASNAAKARSYIPADESTSIENQRELLSKFAMFNGWVETRTYIDDGYSGGRTSRCFTASLVWLSKSNMRRHQALLSNPRAFCRFPLSNNIGSS